MKLNVDQPLFDHAGNIMLGDEGKPIRLGGYLARNIASISDNSVDVSQGLDLALRFQAGGEVELSIEEVVLIKRVFNDSLNIPIWLKGIILFFLDPDCISSGVRVKLQEIQEAIKSDIDWVGKPLDQGNQDGS